MFFKCLSHYHKQSHTLSTTVFKTDLEYSIQVKLPRTRLQISLFSRELSTDLVQALQCHPRQQICPRWPALALVQCSKQREPNIIS